MPRTKVDPLTAYHAERDRFGAAVRETADDYGRWTALANRLNLSDRLWRLWAVACARRVSGLDADERCDKALAVAERFADGGATGEELAAASAVARDAAWTAARDAAGAVARDAASAVAWAAAWATAWATASAVAWAAARDDAWAAQSVLLWSVVGPKTRFARRWRTGTAVGVAARMYETRDFGAMPILADALEDAGADGPVLWHCRQDGLTTCRGDWVVDYVLGKRG